MFPFVDFVARPIHDAVLSCLAFTTITETVLKAFGLSLYDTAEKPVVTAQSASPPPPAWQDMSYLDQSNAFDAISGPFVYVLLLLLVILACIGVRNDAIFEDELPIPPHQPSSPPPSRGTQTDAPQHDPEAIIRQLWEENARLLEEKRGQDTTTKEVRDQSTQADFPNCRNCTGFKQLQQDYHQILEKQWQGSATLARITDEKDQLLEEKRRESANLAQIQREIDQSFLQLGQRDAQILSLRSELKVAERAKSGAETRREGAEKAAVEAKNAADSRVRALAKQLEEHEIAEGQRELTETGHQNVIEALRKELAASGSSSADLEVQKKSAESRADRLEKEKLDWQQREAELLRQLQDAKKALTVRAIEALPVTAQHEPSKSNNEPKTEPENTIPEEEVYHQPSSPLAAPAQGPRSQTDDADPHQSDGEPTTGPGNPIPRNEVTHQPLSDLATPAHSPPAQMDDANPYQSDGEPISGPESLNPDEEVDHQLGSPPVALGQSPPMTENAIPSHSDNEPPNGAEIADPNREINQHMSSPVSLTQGDMDSQAQAANNPASTSDNDPFVVDQPGSEAQAEQVSNQPDTDVVMADKDPLDMDADEFFAFIQSFEDAPQDQPPATSNQASDDPNTSSLFDPFAPTELDRDPDQQEFPMPGDFGEGFGEFGSCPNSWNDIFGNSAENALNAAPGGSVDDVDMSFPPLDHMNSSNFTFEAQQPPPDAGKDFVEPTAIAEPFASTSTFPLTDQTGNGLDSNTTVSFNFGVQDTPFNATRPIVDQPTSFTEKNQAVPSPRDRQLPTRQRNQKKPLRRLVPSKGQGDSAPSHGPSTVPSEQPKPFQQSKPSQQPQGPSKTGRAIRKPKSRQQAQSGSADPEPEQPKQQTIIGRNIKQPVSLWRRQQAKLPSSDSSTEQKGQDEPKAATEDRNEIPKMVWTEEPPVDVPAGTPVTKAKRYNPRTRRAETPSESEEDEESGTSEDKEKSEKSDDEEKARKALDEELFGKSDDEEDDIDWENVLDPALRSADQSPQFALPDSNMWGGDIKADQNKAQQEVDEHYIAHPKPEGDDNEDDGMEEEPKQDEESEESEAE